MADRPSPSTAQMIDTFLQRTALGLVLIATKFAVTALAPFFTAVNEGLVDIITVLLSISAVLVVFPSFSRYLDRRRKDKAGCKHMESYLATMFREAAIRAFTATFVLIVGLQMFVDLASSDLPVPFYLDLIMAVMAGSAAISFFLLVRDDEDNADDDLDPEANA